MATSRKIGKIRVSTSVRLSENPAYMAFIRDFRLISSETDVFKGEVIMVGLHPQFAMTSAKEAPEYALNMFDSGAYKVTPANAKRVFNDEILSPYVDEYRIEPQKPKDDAFGPLKAGPGLMRLAEPRSPELGYEVLSHYGTEYPAPEYAHAGDSGFDLRAAVSQNIHLHPLERMLVPTGLKFQIPGGFEIQVRPRSGLAHKHGITVLNTPGTVDQGYTGEVKVMLINLGDKPYVIAPGERIAQAVLAPVARLPLQQVESVENTDERGQGGFGSTGKR